MLSGVCEDLLESLIQALHPFIRERPALDDHPLLFTESWASLHGPVDPLGNSGRGVLLGLSLRRKECPIGSRRGRTGGQGRESYFQTMKEVLRRVVSKNGAEKMPSAAVTPPRAGEVVARQRSIRRESATRSRTSLRIVVPVLSFPECRHRTETRCSPRSHRSSVILFLRP
jgi:hypothetical protein